MFADGPRAGQHANDAFTDQQFLAQASGWRSGSANKVRLAKSAKAMKAAMGLGAAADPAPDVLEGLGSGHAGFQPVATLPGQEADEPPVDAALEVGGPRAPAPPAQP